MARPLPPPLSLFFWRLHLVSTSAPCKKKYKGILKQIVREGKQQNFFPTEDLSAAYKAVYIFCLPKTGKGGRGKGLSTPSSDRFFFQLYAISCPECFPLSLRYFLSVPLNRTKQRFNTQNFWGLFEKSYKKKRVTKKAFFWFENDCTAYSEGCGVRIQDISIRIHTQCYFRRPPVPH